MSFTPTEKIWMNGKLVNWPDAKIHVLSHVVHYGSSVFEGIRCYKTKKGRGVFRLQGHTDRPLTDAGWAQAHALAAKLENEALDAVYTSDLARAHDTAQVVADSKGLAVTVLRDLREKNFGSWEGLTDNEVLRRFPDAQPGHWGDGETRREMSRRVIAALLRIAAAHPRGRVLVVTHGGPLRAVLRRGGSDREGPIGNGDVIQITVAGGLVRAVD